MDSDFKFWNTEESSLWEGDASSSKLHDSLFHALSFPMENESSKKKKRKRKGQVELMELNRDDNGQTKKQKRDSETTSPVSTPTDARKKQKKRKNNGMNLTSESKERFLVGESGPELNVLKTSSVPKTTKPDNSANEVLKSADDDSQSQQFIDDSKTSTKKKRKRKPKNNKFKDASVTDNADLGNGELRTGMNQNSHNAKLIRASGVNEEQKLTRMQRKKLKRKLAKQQLRTKDEDCDEMHVAPKSSQVAKSESSHKDEIKFSDTDNKIVSKDGDTSQESKLTKHERRKLKRKLARQQNRNEDLDKENPVAKKSKPAMACSSVGQTVNMDKLLNIQEDEKTMNENCNVENEKLEEENDETQLILVSSKRTSKSKLSKSTASLKNQMESQLKSSQFRFLNEQLYKVTGDKAKDLFFRDKDAFVTYHEGFTQQVEHWPVNPVDVIIDALKKRPAAHLVGDFGCGDAKIARSVKQKVHSFDLSAINDHVTVCDIAKVPLDDECLDVAVFCLSLMGTNWMEYLQEANRVLKTGGLLKVAEVASRFTSLPAFLSVMKSLGFQLKQKDVSNKMFYLFDFKKKQRVNSVPSVKAAILKPCLYKKR